MFKQRRGAGDGGRTTRVTVDLSNALAGAVKIMAARQDLTESEMVEEMLTNAFLYYYGDHYLRHAHSGTPLVRLANALMVRAIDAGADTLWLTPADGRIAVRPERGGRPVVWPDDAPQDLPGHLLHWLYHRFEHMAGGHVRHAIDRPAGVARVRHDGLDYELGVKFLPPPEGEKGEVLELSFRTEDRAPL